MKDNFLAAADRMGLVSKYTGRPGYDPDFLGDGFRIDLPSVRAPRKTDLLLLPGGGARLDYWTYSVLMSRSRRLPILSAANYCHPEDQKRIEHNDRQSWWAFDPRLAEDPEAAKALQAGSDWYRSVPDRPFDRGHMTAFENTDWGQHALRNGVDSFHLTNAVPQAEAFNQTQVWRQIEVWAAGKGDSRVQILNGPIFDAPPSTPGADDNNPDWVLNPDADPAPDPVFENLAVPKQFFKVVAYVEYGHLDAQAFVVTQESYLHRLRGVVPGGPLPERLSVYRVPLSTVAHLTGLDLDPLAGKVSHVNKLRPDDPQLIRTEDDLG